jgi:hypothetical protein
MSKNVPPPKHVPSSKKEVRVEAVKPADTNPSWRFSRLDFDGPWCPKKMGGDGLTMVVAKLQGYESMSWNVMHSSGSHAREVGLLTKDAQQRLRDLKLDDVDQLYSLRCQGKVRLWGIKRGNILSVLWWDPEHEICPSPKKHT